MRCSDWFPKIATVALALLLASAAPAAARDMFGVRTGFYTDVDEPFIGIEGLFGLGNHVYLNPNFEYVFTEDPHYMTFNADFHYDFPTRSRAYVWAGAGLGVLYKNPEVGDSNTDVGLNLLFGVGLKGHVVPYVQGKVIVSEDTAFVLGVGLRF
ncbi:MAG: hypothetical protein ACHP85_04790 [Burkholderiales bacterium]|jgi:hypothetical protein